MKAPSPPDPYEQADAQAGANIDSAIATDLLNNRSEITPTGRVDYIDQGYQTITDSQGNTRQIPIRSREVTLSPNQQNLLDLTEQTSQNLLGTAVERSDFLSDYLKDGLDTSSLTPWAEPANAPGLDTSTLDFEPLQQYGGPRGGLVYGYDANTVSAPGELSGVEAPRELAGVAAPDELSGIGAPGELSQVRLNTSIGARVGGGGGMNVGMGDAAKTFDARNLNQSIASGDVPGAGQGIQDSVNLNTQGGTIDTLQRDYQVDRVSGDIADAGAIERFDGSGTFDDTWGIQRNLPDYNNYEDQRTRVDDAVMSRYDRHFADMEAALDQKLRNQGLVPGSEAYDTQFRQLREQQNDAAMQAILVGGQEQSRLAGLDAQAARFGLDAQRQGFDQAEAQGMFALGAMEANNRAQGQEFGQNDIRTQRRMSAIDQNNRAEEARARFRNEAQDQYFDQTLANVEQANAAELEMGRFANEAQDQRVSQMSDQTSLQLDATKQNNQFELDRGALVNEGASIVNDFTVDVGGLQNQAADIENQRALDAARLQMDAQVASNDASLAQAGFNNEATTQNLANQLDAVGFNNDIITQGLTNQRDATGFNNDIISQGLTNHLDATGFNNETVTQGLDNEIAAMGFNNDLAAALAAFNNTAYGQDVAGGLSMAGFNNTATQQNNQNLAAQQAALNAYLAQQFGLDQTAVDRQNQFRQSELQEAAYLRGLPISEINSLMSGSELLMPQFTPPLQTGIQPVDIAGYIDRNYQQEAANANAFNRGLFGFAGNVLPAMIGSDRRLKKDIEPLGKLSNGIPVYSFTYRHNGQKAVGVVADEAKLVVPDSVANIGGIDFVDYGKVVECR